MDRESSSSPKAIVPDIEIAAVIAAPVLISAPASRALAIARAIARISNADAPPRIIIGDAEGAHPRTTLASRLQAATVEGPAIFLVREVQDLTADEQASLSTYIEEMWDRSNAPRIIASTSIDLHSRMLEGQFDATLFYRLNVVHLSEGDAPIGSRDDADHAESSRGPLETPDHRRKPSSEIVVPR